MLKYLSYNVSDAKYQRIFDKLHLDTWLYHASEEQGFRVLNVSGIISQEVEFDLTTKIRAHIMRDTKHFDIQVF